MGSTVCERGGRGRRERTSLFLSFFLEKKRREKYHTSYFFLSSILLLLISHATRHIYVRTYKDTKTLLSQKKSIYLNREGEGEGK